MTVVLIGWVVFRAESLAQAGTLYLGMTGWNGLAATPETLMLARPTEIICLVLGLLIACAPRDARSNPFHIVGTARLPSLAGLQSVVLLWLCTAVMQARSDSPFLYFQF